MIPRPLMLHFRINFVKNKKYSVQLTYLRGILLCQEIKGSERLCEEACQNVNLDSGRKKWNAGHLQYAVPVFKIFLKIF